MEKLQIVQIGIGVTANGGKATSIVFMWIYQPYLSSRGAVFYSEELDLSSVAADIAGHITSKTPLFGTECLHGGKVAMIADDWEDAARVYMSAGGSLDDLEILTPRAYAKSKETFEFVIFSGFWSRKSERTVDKLLKLEKAIPILFLTNFTDLEYAYAHELPLFKVDLVKHGFVIVPERLPMVAATFKNTTIADTDTVSIAWNS